MLNKEKPLRIHLIGVAGSGMSGLALLLMGMGHRVSGSDRVTSRETERLQSNGLAFSSPHSGEAVVGADLVVFSSAIRPSNPAFAEAVNLRIPMMLRAECLAAVLASRKGILVSGTHGKTTTSSMTAHVLREAGMRPSHYVGAEIPVLGANAKWDEDGEYMVAEGDESDGTLVLYEPECAIVLNIEAEHLDFYRDIDHICDVFGTLVERTRGALVYCKEDPVAAKLLDSHPRSVSYGWANARYVADEVRELGGSSAFRVLKDGEMLGQIELGIPGRHNILNSLAAIALADSLGAAFPLIARALATFAGAKRRFETKHFSSFCRVVDDYGHHPTELAATLQTARSLKPQRVVVIFQPHRYSRTQALADDFGKALQQADEVFVTSVYAASELPIEGVSGQLIVDAVKKYGDIKVKYLPQLSIAHHEVGNALQEGDLLITLGAGNVHEAGSKIVADLKVLEEMIRFAPQGEMLGKLYEPMRRHTTMLVGGPAQYWLEPQTFAAFAAAVRYCRERSIPVRVMGRGSNVIVRDGGIRGAVIHPAGGVFSEVRMENGYIIAGAGARLKKVASVAQQHGIGGFEWMEGIPGNVGGALRMNAGAMGIEMFDQVVSLTMLDEDGEIRERMRGDIDAQYRNVPVLRRNFALQCVLQGAPDSAENIQQRWNESRAKRKTSQPIAASAGCMFKNPTAECPAGKLVDELGLKGLRHGNAEVSMVHGNFITNTGGASASDVISLVQEIQLRAMQSRSIEIEMEVKLLGEDECTF
jgi:UDP-N-acetylmuramate--alanine ligase